MNKSEIFQALENAEIFGTLPKPVLEALASHFEIVQVDKGEYLFFEGDSARRIYISPNAPVKIVRHSTDGKEVLLEVVAEGRPFALLSGIEGNPLSASGVAMEKCVMLSISRERFLSLLEQHPVLSLSVIHDFAARLRDARDRIRSLALDRVEQRIARVLLMLVESLGKRREGKVILDLALTRQDIASMVGTTVESAIRTMSRFQKDAVLRTTNPGRIEILNMAALESIAESGSEDAPQRQTEEKTFKGARK